MVKRSKKAYNSEFPVLDGLGLYPASTKGDGNCLFRALSDQVYGDESHHKEVRQKIVEYVKQNGNHFSAFVGEYGETFDQYVSRLAQDGVYGGHIEIVGFADVNVMPVVIYQAETLYVVEPQVAPRSQWGKPVHIAYHTWEHYSSVRKVGGPQSGPVDFEIPQLSDLDSVHGANETSMKSEAEEVPKWKINIVQKSVPDASEELIISMLRKKDHEQVIEELIMKEFESPGDEGPSESNIEDEKLNSVEVSSDSKSSALPSPEGKQITEAGASDKNAKASRKQDAKKRRSERKERVRVKKSRSKKQSEDEPESRSSDSDKPRIITI